MNLAFEELAFLSGCGVTIAVIAVLMYLRRRHTEGRSRSRYEELVAAGVEVPPTLHPVFDATKCIGSLSCASACPHGNGVIGLIDGRGALVDPTRCIGHGRCAAECPVDAIKLVFGTSERGVDIPHLKPTFETNVPGIYITGELGGMGLISNAVRQAIEGMQNLTDSLPAARASAASGAGIADVAIVGSGPAGLTSALMAVKLGLSYRWLEREPDVGGSILHYPRRKIVLLEPVELPLLKKLPGKTLLKEELLEIWRTAVNRHSLAIETGKPVDDIRRTDGCFTLSTPSGAVPARTVMLCAGRRGSPRKLGVPGEESQNVAYSMPNPEMYAGRRVLVVGGGDSALEAACQLADETDAAITLSYRRRAISRAKPENVRRFGAHVEKRRIGPIWESEVVEIGTRSVSLKMPGGVEKMENDDVLIFAGGEPCAALLSRAGVTMQRCFGETAPDPLARRTTGPVAVYSGDRCADFSPEPPAGFGGVNPPSPVVAVPTVSIRRKGRIHLSIFVITFSFFSCVFCGVLLWAGRGYYFAGSEAAVPEAARTFRPAGIWGQNIGAIAFLFMLSNLVYYLRKEFTFMKGMGDIRGWMQFHLVSGLASGVIALVHSALLLNNIFGLMLYATLAAVIVTGITGRYIYGLVPHDGEGAGGARLKGLLGWWRLGHGALAFFLLILVVAHVVVEFWVGYRWIF